MRVLLPLLVALVLGAIVFFATETSAVEACIRAIVTVIIVLFLGVLVTRAGRKRND